MCHFELHVKMRMSDEIKEINDYTVKETIKIIFLTLFTILIVCLLAFIIYVLWAQVIDFVQQIPREVVYKFD